MWRSFLPNGKGPANNRMTTLSIYPADDSAGAFYYLTISDFYSILFCVLTLDEQVSFYNSVQ